jgi:hypothetical protein
MYPSAVIPHSGDGYRLFFLYMPMEYQDNVGQDTFKLYYINTGTNRRYLARSINSGITWTDTQYVNVQDLQKGYEAIIQNPDSNKKYMSYNRWIGQNTSYMCNMVSTDGGFSFADTGVVMQMGEDKSFIWNEDTNEYWGYVRPRNIEPSCSCYVQNCFSVGNGVRKIALMKNSSFFPYAGAWTARDTIVEIDPNDYTNVNSPDYRTQPYYMQVFRSGSDWWGLVGMYRVGNNGGELNSIPYTDPEYTSDVELMWSDNGEDWYRTNNRQPFIALHDSIKTIYSVGTLVGDSVYIYSSESTRLHAGYYNRGCYYWKDTDSASYKGKFYSIYLYKIGIDKLNEWRPPSIVNINYAVEGFLNTGTGKHNLRDTLTAELRNSTSPYAIASTTKSIIDSVTFLGAFNFPHVNPGNYYLTVYGRNSLETWSSNSISISNGTNISYNFTSSSIKAYGGNLVLKGSEYCIFSGDVNNDGSINLADENLINADYSNFVSGYVKTDVNGDFNVDLADLNIAYNNSNNFVSVIHP